MCLGKKIATLMLSVVMAVTTMAASVVTASAEDEKVTYLKNYKVATAKSGTEYDLAANKDDGHWYSFTLKSDTVVSIKYRGAHGGAFEIYKQDGTDKENKKADYINGASGLIDDTKHIKLTKGTYYISWTQKSDFQSWFKITWTEQTKKATVLRLYIPLKVGDKMKLTTYTDSTEAITFKSSNTKVATVTSKGVITAKKAGKFSLYVSTGGKAVKYYFKVSE